MRGVHSSLEKTDAYPIYLSSYLYFPRGITSVEYPKRYMKGRDMLSVMERNWSGVIQNSKDGKREGL